VIADDQIPQHSLIQQLYDEQIMTDFVGAVVNSGPDPRAPKPLYLLNDAYAALNVQTHSHACRRLFFCAADALPTPCR
jgi:hypothetical protein